MSTMVLRYDSDSQEVVCIVPYHKTFVRYLTSNIPKTQRKFEAVEKTWRVKGRHLTRLARYGIQCFDHLDATGLPARWRSEVEALIAKHSNRLDDIGTFGEVPNDDYSVLYLLPSAPLELVEKVFRYLASVHHPDHGGDVEKFMEIKEAYTKIKQRKNDVN